MKLTYETGIATLVQFVVLSFLNIANNTGSAISGCRKNGSDCISNILVSLIFYLLIVGWFGAVWAVGYLAQEKRSHRLAQLLICAEIGIAGLALINLKLHNKGDYLSLFTSAVDLVLSIWVITVAYRLMRAKGGRVVTGNRTRQRKHTL